MHTLLRCTTAPVIVRPVSLASSSASNLWALELVPVSLSPSKLLKYCCDATHSNSSKTNSTQRSNRIEPKMDSARALECLADSPPDLFVYSPLNAEKMDSLNVLDEVLPRCRLMRLEAILLG